ncbi:thioredoxin family protein [Belliella sp. DSM 111904]|uniref:Thioredoxin family protein n=1 Tax=Belliella filtrata TaxID=2923435 RepID=A0ABS9UYW1_9BACT|nr:cytochrome c biogenesis protein CcdA [Belliella filtrata]MCH7408925.1 thioredoxin family protein [Belliella filtrata]
MEQLTTRKANHLTLIILIFCLITHTAPSFGQIHDPVKWHFSTQKVAGEQDIYEISFQATIAKGWHIYSPTIPEGGPVPTRIHIESNSNFELVGNTESLSSALEKFEAIFDMNISYYDHEAIFSQKVKLNADGAQVNGYIEFMACNDENCLPPAETNFSIALGESSLDKEVLQDNSFSTSGDAGSQAQSAASGDEEITDLKNSLWGIFIAGFLGGLAALLMPCIFPMLPLTISYFTKSNDQGSAIGKALIYGFSIIVIYVFLGLAITVIFGADAMNALSTNGFFNFFFFLLLVIFAASFFGAFELTLPSSWANKLDRKSDQGGLLGIFFMAATLAIVSFSCTGPIIGTLLVQAASMGEYLGPSIGMLGFSIALAAPFALFAMFPSLLKSLPKSGGWLNSVKVVLGFLELALALKFLSNVDLAYHWNWFDREVFLVLWIAIFGLLAMYLLGKIKFIHDSPSLTVSTPRIFLSILVLAFTIYLIPGLWGAPLKAVSAFLPPQHTQDFDLYTNALSSSHHVEPKSNIPNLERKYAKYFHAPLNLDPFYDFEEGIAHAAKVNMPVLIDFTGHACVNCRKMEASIWSVPDILRIIKEEYVLIQLYVDDKTMLPIPEQFISAYSGKKIKNLGQKWSDLQAQLYNSNAQPYYVLLNPKVDKLLTQPVGAIYDATKYKSFLESGLDAFQ